MTAKSVLIRPQGLRPESHTPTCPLLLRHCGGAFNSCLQFLHFNDY